MTSKTLVSSPSPPPATCSTETSNVPPPRSKTTIFILLLVEAVGESGGGGLVDDAGDFEAGDLAGVLGGLALGIVEVEDRDDGLVDLVAEVSSRL